MPLVLHCTAKLVRELPESLVQRDPGSTADEAWCLNLLRLDRKKCLLATHEASLFSVFVSGVSRADLRDLPVLFLTSLEETLASEGLRCRLGPDPSSILVTRASIRQRRVLGSMNELAFQLAWSVDRRGGLARCDRRKIRHDLNRVLMRYPDGSYDEPMDRVGLLGVAPHG